MDCGMLHRTKYNRFRNESVTSVDELLHGLSMNPKVSATPQSAAETSYTPPTEVQPSSTTTASSTPTSHGSDHLEDGGTTLCTLINKVSSLKFSNSGSLLGIKGLPSAVKDLAVSKLQGGGGSGSGCSSGPNPSAPTAAAAASGVGSSLCSSASHSTPCSQLEPAVSMSKKSRLDELQLGGEDWHPGGGGGLVSKPSRGWLHSSEKISGPGVTYIVKYLGCIEVLRSMRSLDFTTRSQITREAISLVCEAVPGTKGALRKRKPPSKALSSILGKSNLQFAGMSINLNISTSSLNLMAPDCKQIIANHHMQSISFASGGDPDTTDYVAYVAKDPVNRRACHILECSDGLAQDVISTIGQAFDLRFQLYLQCPSSKLSSTHDRVLNMEELPWTEEEEESAEHPYYNNIPGKMPPPGGFIDTRLTNQNVAPDGCQPFEDAIQSQSHPPTQGQAQSQVSSLQKEASVDNSSPLLVRSVAFRAQEELEGQTWYHGKMSRRDAEKLLKEDGDFLVRKSTTNPGSYVLTGMHNGLAKHLLLVDPEGTVRTKDHIFDSISHLIGHHRDNNLPIVSAGSELCLLQPVGRKQ
uniref:SHC adaptor protein 3 n=2 Tax=Sander lucioperca TaxID=283035 RepID=A0A8D0CUQ4_SANLU